MGTVSSQWASPGAASGAQQRAEGRDLATWPAGAPQCPKVVVGPLRLPNVVDADRVTPALLCGRADAARCTKNTRGASYRCMEHQHVLDAAAQGTPHIGVAPRHPVVAGGGAGCAVVGPMRLGGSTHGACCGGEGRGGHTEPLRPAWVYVRRQTTCDTYHRWRCTLTPKMSVGIHLPHSPNRRAVSGRCGSKRMRQARAARR